MDALGPTDLIPGTERYLKREATVVLRAYQLGCGLGAINEIVKVDAQELEAASLAGSTFLRSVINEGYFDETLFPDFGSN